MGVPIGHPFLGNQYTDGGYIHGSYSYISEMGKGVESLKGTSSDLVTALKNGPAKQNPINPSDQIAFTKNFDKNVLIIGGVILVVTVGSLITYKCYKKRKKKNQSLCNQWSN